MHRRRLAAALAAGAFVLVAAGPALAAAPPGTLDQSHECAATNCNLVDQAVYPQWYSVNPPVVGGTVALAQTFKPGVSGTLSGVELYLQLTDSGSPTTFTVSILPTIGGIPQMQSPLATATVDPITSGIAIPAPAWIPITFSTPPTLTAGSLYAIAIGNGAQATAWLQWQVDAAWGSGGYTDYANGDAFVGTGPGAPNDNWAELFQVLNPSGGNADFAFRTYMNGAVATATPTATPAPTPTASTAPATATATIPATDVLAAGSGGTGSPDLTPVLLLVGIVSVAAVALVPWRRREVDRSR